MTSTLMYRVREGFAQMQNLQPLPKNCTVTVLKLLNWTFFFRDLPPSSQPMKDVSLNWYSNLMSSRWLFFHVEWDGEGHTRREEETAFSFRTIFPLLCHKICFLVLLLLHSKVWTFLWSNVRLFWTALVLRQCLHSALVKMLDLNRICILLQQQCSRCNKGSCL